MLAQIDQNLKQLIDVGEVKIAGQQQVTRFPVVGTHNGVYPFDIVIAVSAVAQVSE